MKLVYIGKHASPMDGLRHGYVACVQWKTTFLQRTITGCHPIHFPWAVRLVVDRPSVILVKVSMQFICCLFGMHTRETLQKAVLHHTVQRAESTSGKLPMVERCFRVRTRQETTCQVESLAGSGRMLPSSVSTPKRNRPVADTMATRVAEEQVF